MTLTKVPQLPSGERPETGPMQFGDDWPGVFIRGDNAMHYAMTLLIALNAIPQERFMERSVLMGLAKALRSCNARDLQ